MGKEPRVIYIKPYRVEELIARLPLRIGDVIQSKKFVYGFYRGETLVLDGNPCHIMNRPLTDEELNAAAHSRGYKDAAEFRKKCAEFEEATGHFAAAMCIDVNVVSEDKKRRAAKYVIQDISVNRSDSRSRDALSSRYAWEDSLGTIIVLHLVKTGKPDPYPIVAVVESLNYESRDDILTAKDIKVVGRANP
jgi:hypothetical protein